MNDYQKIADLLFPDLEHDADYYLNKYKKRDLKEGQIVSRFAPSPTGFMHIGNFFQMFISYNLARVTNGIMFLRIEDTDFKREVANAKEVIYDIIGKFGLKINEYQTLDGKDIGEYGPYVQSQRRDIYRAFAKLLVEKGRAFPCFCPKTEGKEDILKLRETKFLEEDDKEYDKCRDLSYEEIKSHIDNGESFAIRLKTLGTGKERIKYVDLSKGEMETAANAKDIIILKDNGIPPYAFAHVVDDTLMGTTVVVRGQEYFSSVQQHIELFDAFGFKPTAYCHNPLISKIDEKTGNKRKISKSKDREANMQFFFEQGYPRDAVLEYLLNIINSSFESWRANNLDASWQDFKFDVHDITAVSPLFDMVKLNDISKNLIATMTAAQVYENLLAWASEYEKDFAKQLSDNKEYAVNVFSIDRYTPKPRKDIYKWSDVKSYYSYMFTPCFLNDNLSYFDFNNEKFDKNTLSEVIKYYRDNFDPADEKDVWFARMKALCANVGFCSDMKEYKKDPSLYKGNVADFSSIIRVALTLRQNSLDLYEIIKVLGKDEVITRFNTVIELLK